MACLSSSSFFLFLERGAGRSPLFGARLVLCFFLSSDIKGLLKSGLNESWLSEKVYAKDKERTSKLEKLIECTLSKMRKKGK